MSNSANAERVFKPLMEALLGPTAFPFEWEGWTSHPPLPTPPAPAKPRQG